MFHLSINELMAPPKSNKAKVMKKKKKKSSLQNLIKILNKLEAAGEYPRKKKKKNK